MTDEILGVRKMGNAASANDVRACSKTNAVTIIIGGEYSTISPASARRFARMLTRLAKIAERTDA